MKSKFLSVIPLVLILILSACSPLQIASASGEQPAPTVEELPATGYQTVTIDQVEVEVGVGSPIPVHVIVSGNLPDICSQVEHTEIKQDGSNFIITIYATPEVESCLKDTLPFKVGIPLNVIDLPGGSYSVTVNGSRANFELEAGLQVSPSLAADTPIVKDDIQVDSVNIDVGRGSPLPVHAVVSGNLPNACAHLGEVRLHRDETTFLVRLVAYAPAQNDCNEDSIPFRLEVPLNIVNLPEGPYTINVNGATASFDPRAIPAPVNEAESSEERNLVAIEHVGIQAGVGSPISVEIVASGTWPDLCAQIAEVQSKMDGFQIDVTILASTVEACPPDQLGLPFRFALPLNIVEMPAGEYKITVNGTSTTLQLPLSP
jgi:hypothetical protein